MSISNLIHEPAPAEPAQPQPNRVWLSIFGVLLVVGILAAAGYAFLAVQQSIWPFLTLAIAFGLVAVLSLPALQAARQGGIPSRQLWLVSGLLAATLAFQATTVNNTGLPTALIFLVYSLILASLLSTSGSATPAILLGLIAAAAISLLGAFSPLVTITFPLANIVLWSVLALALVAYAVMQIAGRFYLTLQIRLTTAFIAIVVVSIAAATITQSQVAIRELRANTSNNVVITANQVALSLDQFLDTTMKAVQQEALLDPLYRFLEVRATGQPGEAELQEVKTTFRLLQVRETSERVYLSSYALLDKNGVNVYDSTESNIGLSEGNEEYFLQPFETGEAYLSGVTFSSAGYSYIYFSAPVRDLKRQTIGVLRVRYNALVFQRVLEAYSGLLGPNSHAILFDQDSIRLADTYDPDLVYATIIPLTIEQTTQLNAQHRLPTRPDMQISADQPELAQALEVSDQSPSFSLNLDPPETDQSLLEIGGVAKMSGKPWKIVYLQANFDDASIREGQYQIATLIATLIAVLVGFISVILSNILSAPIKSLTATAERISQGDVNATAGVLGNDEFGTLGRAFNQMTAQLRAFINELEDRVNQRTQEIARQNENLTYRTRQLQTVAEVARSIVTSQELLPLLDSVTHLISARFDFYHVGVFLIDAPHEYAVLRAANSEGGQRMLARHHRLAVGKTGIVGFVTATGQPRIATDVGEDSVFFDNPDLPLTRSEMALPLKVGDEIIGALDVQSMEANAFTGEDIDLFSTLADQVAVAIYNNQLYVATAAALTESQSLHRQYLRQEWGRDLATRPTRGVQYTAQGLAAYEDDIHDVENIFQTGEPYLTTEELPDHTTRSVMAVPIILRGEPIGVIRVQDNLENRTWSEDEFAAVREVAQQVGVALESARLLEQTVQRAEREKKVMEITGMIRSTTDPQQMLEIAASELQKALGASRAQIFIHKPTRPLSGLPTAGGDGRTRRFGGPDDQEDQP